MKLALTETPKTGFVELRPIYNWPAHMASSQENTILLCTKNKDADQHLHPCSLVSVYVTVKSALSGHSKGRPKIGFQDRLLLNASEKYCRMLQGEYSAILSTFIKLPFVFKTFILSLFLGARLRQVLLYLLFGEHV